MIGLRLALLACPPEFRAHYARELERTYRSRRSALARAAAAADVAATGLELRAENAARDVVVAVRALERGRLFTAMAVLAVALALAANIAVASVLEGVVLRPLPYPHPEQLVFVSTTRVTPATEFSYPMLRDIARETHAFGATGGVVFESGTLEGHGRPAALSGAVVTSEYLAALGAPAQLGRLLDARDLGTANIVIADGVWRTLFGASPDALGARVQLDGRAYTIVGVTARDFRIPEPVGLVAVQYLRAVDPHAPAATTRSLAAFDAVVRLAPGVGVRAAERDFQRTLDALARPGGSAQGQPLTAALTPALDAIAGPVRALLWLLVAAVAIVFVIACANVANIALVRAVARAREFALRTALGATRRRIMQQLLTESFLVAAAGGAAGCALGALALQAFGSVGTRVLPRWENVGVDAGIAGYAGVLVIAATLITGVVPALLVRRDLADALKASGTTDERPANKRARSALVVAEIALAMAVVVSAGLVVRSFAALESVDIGFSADGVDSVRVDLSSPRFAAFGEQLRVLHRAADALRTVPGVSAVAIAGHLPFSNDSGITISTTPGGRAAPVALSAVGADFFRALRIPIVRGRAIDARDRAGAQAVAVVNAAFALRAFGTLDAVGRRVFAGTSALTIAGVAGNTRNALGEPAAPRVFLPIEITPGYRSYQLAVRAAPGVTPDALSAAVARSDPRLPEPVVRRFSDVVAESGARSRGSALLFGALAVVALALALTGIYAVTAYSVERRSREFGIRKAVGARSRRVLANVVSATLVQSAVGIGIGIVLSAAFSRALSAVLFQTSPFDAATFAAVVALLMSCSVAAALLPAVRAMRVDPAVALRYE